MSLHRADVSFTGHIVNGLMFCVSGLLSLSCVVNRFDRSTRALACSVSFSLALLAVLYYYYISLYAIAKVP